MARFALDRLPVSNGEFLQFVRRFPEWRRGRVPHLFADERYLTHWSGPLQLGPEADPDAPVVQVSWFAARAYCESVGRRLPTEDEWELAAAAGEAEKDARADPAWRDRILEWYSRPSPPRWPRRGQGRPNAWGIYDLHGLVWEWVEDFNSTLLSNDSRESGDNDALRFCGSGAYSARDKEDYAGFMRIAFRSSLGARDTTRNLGFRCASDVQEHGP